MSNILYIGSTPDAYVFHVGMTHGRSPYERWKDYDYRAKLSYVPKKVAFYLIGLLRDEPVHAYILKDRSITSVKEEEGIRSDEIFRVNSAVLDPKAYIKKVVEEAIQYENTGVRPVEKFFVSRPHQEWANAVTLDQWNGKTIILPQGYCARFGKGLHYIDLFKKSGFRTMIVASYWLAANETFVKTVEEKWDITSDITVISPSYDQYVEAIAKGGRVLIDVSLHIDSDKIDDRLLDVLSKEQSLIVVDEADYGAWTPTSRSVLNQYINSGNNLVCIATGTNLERALIGHHEIINPITVSYLDLLEAKQGKGYLFNPKYKASGPREEKVLSEIRKDPSKWYSRLADIVEVASLSLDANSTWIAAANDLNGEDRPNMTKVFARRNSHIQREVIRQLFDTSGDGTDVWTIFSNIATLPVTPAAMMFVPGTTGDVDNFVSLGKSICTNVEWVALHSKDGLSNRIAEKYVNDLISNTDKEAVVIVSCSMGARSFSIPNCVISINCVDNPSIATAVQRASRCFTPGVNKTLGLVIDYCFNPSKTSTFETDLIRSALDNKVDSKEDTETTVRRVYGLVNFMRMDQYGYPVKLKQSEFVEFVTSPVNLRNMALATTDFEKLQSIPTLTSLLESVKAIENDKNDDLRSLIDGAKTYISERGESNKNVDPKHKSIKDLKQKIQKIIDTVGNVHALSPQCDHFVDAIDNICLNKDKSDHYTDLVGVSPDVIQYLSEYLPISLLDLYLIRARKTSSIEKFESEYAKDNFLFLPEQVLI
jgi:hypothetical protein